MATITKLEKVSGRHRHGSAEVLEAARQWLGHKTDEWTLFRKFAASSRMQNRYYCLQAGEILNLRGNAERAAIFSEIGAEMAAEAVSAALGDQTSGYSDVESMVFTSCTVPAIPTLDVQLMNRLPLSSNMRRLPIYQYGCAGGVAGLSLAAELHRRGRSILVSSELCSLLFHREDIAVHHLVGAAIFSDGAACAVLQDDGPGLEVVASRSHLIPNSAHIMGYDISDTGSHLRLHRELPTLLGENVREIVASFLASHGLRPEKIAYWLLHPGGTAILEGIEQIFGLDRNRTQWSWNVLSEFGNMSSSSILFAISAFMQSGVYEDGEFALVLGVGPGLTIETILLRCRCVS